MNKCSNCEMAAVLKNNKLMYCKKCFVIQMHNKVAKNIAKLKYKSKILIFCNGSEASLAMLYILSRLQARDNNSFCVLTTTQHYNKFIESCNFASIEVINNFDDNGFIPKCVYKYANANNFDVLMTQACLEQQATCALALISSGNGMQSVVETCLSTQNPQIINLFANIKAKQILYYIFMNNLPRTSVKTAKSKIESILYSFLQKIDKKNSLALYNIIGTLKKINTSNSSSISQNSLDTTETKRK